jgi:hypothetical protein
MPEHQKGGGGALNNPNFTKTAPYFADLKQKQLSYKINKDPDLAGKQSHPHPTPQTPIPTPTPTTGLKESSLTQPSDGGKILLWESVHG